MLEFNLSLHVSTCALPSLSEPVRKDHAGVCVGPVSGCRDTSVGACQRGEYFSSKYQK